MTNVPKMKVVTEVAPPQFISVIRRPVEKMATIEEEEREILPAFPSHKSAMTNVPKMRVVTEVIPPQFISSLIRRPMEKMATIDEEEIEMGIGSLSASLQISTK
ncbi:hypothetical protein ACET3Z_023059 [Daucus carota]